MRFFHFSEDPTIEVFVPRDGFVWADDEDHCPRYWFPRDCPRATWWPKGSPSIGRVHAIEWDWFDRFATCALWAYPMPPASFAPAPEGGGWVSADAVVPVGPPAPVGHLLERHRGAGIELRLVDDLLGLWQDVIGRPGIDFSGIRLRNARR